MGRALEGLGGAVPQLAVAIIQAGEMGPGLPQGIRSAAEFYEATAAVRSALTNALIYPAFLLASSIAMLALMGGIVIPRFAGMLGDMRQDLPPLTEAVLAAGRFGEGAVWVLALIPVIIGGVAVAQRRGLVSLEPFYAATLRLPIVGEIRRSWTSANVCATLATLLQSGVVMPVALAHAAEASGDPVVRTRTIAAGADVMKGMPLSAALNGHSALTPLCIQLCQAAEHTGNLAQMLARAADMERARASDALQRGVKLVEPLFILGLGGFVALISAALLQAIYAMRPVP